MFLHRRTQIKMQRSLLILGFYILPILCVVFFFSFFHFVFPQLFEIKLTGQDVITSTFQFVLLCNNFVGNILAQEERQHSTMTSSTRIWWTGILSPTMGHWVGINFGLVYIHFCSFSSNGWSDYLLCCELMIIILY